MKVEMKDGQKIDEGVKISKSNILPYVRLINDFNIQIYMLTLNNTHKTL